MYRGTARVADLFGGRCPIWLGAVGAAARVPHRAALDCAALADAKSSTICKGWLAFLARRVSAGEGHGVPCGAPFRPPLFSRPRVTDHGAMTRAQSATFRKALITGCLYEARSLSAGHYGRRGAWAAGMTAVHSMSGTSLLFRSRALLALYRGRYRACTCSTCRTCPDNVCVERRALCVITRWEHIVRCYCCDSGCCGDRCT